MMLLTWLSSFLAGPIVGAITSTYKAKLEASSTTEAHAVDLAKAEIEAQIEARKAATTILIAEQGHWYTACIRSLFALPFIGYAWADVILHDVLGAALIKELSPNMALWGGMVIASYFGEHIASQVSRIIKR